MSIARSLLFFLELLRASWILIFTARSLSSGALFPVFAPTRKQKAINKPLIEIAISSIAHQSSSLNAIAFVFLFSLCSLRQLSSLLCVPISAIRSTIVGVHWRSAAPRRAASISTRLYSILIYSITRPELNRFDSKSAASFRCLFLLRPYCPDCTRVSSVTVRLRPIFSRCELSLPAHGSASKPVWSKAYHLLGSFHQNFSYREPTLNLFQSASNIHRTWLYFRKMHSTTIRVCRYLHKERSFTRLAKY